MISLTVTLLVVLLLPGVLFFFFKERFLYYPHRLKEGALRQYVSNLPPGGEDSYEEIAFRTEDGETLVGWFGAPVEPKAWLLWFHGNAGSIEHRFGDLWQLVRRCGLAVLIVDYRGYGRSTGSPHEKGLYLDARAAWDALIVRGAEPERIFLLGRSIGGGVAVELATEKPARGLIIESTFTSLSDMAGKVAWWYPPARWIARGRFPTEERIAALTMPIILFHGEDDDLVPLAHGEALAARAGENLTLVPVPGAGHDDVSLTMGRAYFERVSEFVDRCLAE